MYKTGALLLELLVVIGLMAIALPAMYLGLNSAVTGKAQLNQRIQATVLVKEAQEAVKNVREQGWNYMIDNTYHSAVSGSNKWTLVTGTGVINGFTQSIIISDVYRDTSGAIVSSGGTLDPSTKKIDITVSWTTPSSSSVTSTFYITRHGNISYTETTQTDFNDSNASKTDVKVQASAQQPTPTPDDGEIVLSQTGGFGDWCTPVLTTAVQDLPKSGVANAVSAIVGQAAAGTGDNASGVSYANVTITDPAYPTLPSTSIPATFDGFKTNGVFTEQNYAYLTTDTNGKQGVIIDLTNIVNGKYDNDVPYGTLDLQSSSINGQSIYVANNIAYMTATDGKLYTFDLTTRSGSHTAIGSVSLGGIGKKIVVVGTNAYVGINATSNQLQIVNVANPRSMSVTTSISVNGQATTDVFINITQNRAYLVTAQSSTQAEFFVINLTTNTVIGSYDTSAHGNMNPKGVIAVSGSKVIIVGTGGQEYQVLRVDGNYETAPLYCGGIDVDTGINGIATAFSTVTNRAFSYIITGDASSEFKIIEGGPGGTGAGDYKSTGTFISRPFGPLTFDTAFNSFVADIYQPVVTSSLYGVQMQVAVADPVSGSCAGASYNFIGTDSTGTGTTHYFTTGSTGAASITGIIPLNTYSTYKNPSKCFKYKAILNTNDSTLTPVFKDITVNYSP